MKISSDIILKGSDWSIALESLSPFFQPRTNYDIFLLSTSIGIMYDRQILNPEGNTEDTHSVPRNVFTNYSAPFDFLFQTAILTTSHEDINEKDRLDLAFGEEKINYDKIRFLTYFANYGVTKLIELIGPDELSTMENLKNFLSSTMEGTNFDIDPLSDDDIYYDVLE